MTRNREIAGGSLLWLCLLSLCLLNLFLVGCDTFRDTAEVQRDDTRDTTVDQDVTPDQPGDINDDSPDDGGDLPTDIPADNDQTVGPHPCGALGEVLDVQAGEVPWKIQRVFCADVTSQNHQDLADFTQLAMDPDGDLVRVLHSDGIVERRAYADAWTVTDGEIDPIGSLELGSSSASGDNPMNVDAVALMRDPFGRMNIGLTGEDRQCAMEQLDGAIAWLYRFERADTLSTSVSLQAVEVDTPLECGYLPPGVGMLVDNSGNTTQFVFREYTADNSDAGQLVALPFPDAVPNQRQLAMLTDGADDPVGISAARTRNVMLHDRSSNELSFFQRRANQDSGGDTELYGPAILGTTNGPAAFVARNSQTGHPDVVGTTNSGGIGIQEVQCTLDFEMLECTLMNGIDIASSSIAHLELAAVQEAEVLVLYGTAKDVWLTLTDLETEATFTLNNNNAPTDALPVFTAEGTIRDISIDSVDRGGDGIVVGISILYTDSTGQLNEELFRFTMLR